MLREFQLDSKSRQYVLHFGPVPAGGQVSDMHRTNVYEMLGLLHSDSVLILSCAPQSA
jgi:hypothetical protein